MNILPLPVRLWLGRTFFTSFGSCVRISPSRLIKGPTYAGEVEALRLVAEHTSIPVPKVFKVYQRDSGIFIEMEYIRGQNLESIWNTLSDKEKDRFVRELTGQITELRKLKLPTDADPQDAREAGVGSAGMGETMELRLSYEPFGPFKGVEDFHTFVRMNLPLEDTEQSFGTAVYQCHAKHYDVCMTHSDLTLRNMVIDKQGRLTLVDWELAGWRPEYWEYTKAFYDRISNPDYYELIRKHFTNYDSELEAEKHLWHIFDRPWANDVD